MRVESYYYLFPFERVRPGEDIIIYGYGRVGQWFFAQILETRYTHVSAVVDKDYDRYEAIEVPLIPPENIVDLKFDKLIIAIENKKVAETVLHDLINKYGVKKEQIIFEENYKKYVPEIKLPVPILSPDIKLAYQLPGIISVAAWIGGSIGDNIIFKRKIDEIMKLDNNLYLDLYTMPDFKECINWIYGSGAYEGRLNGIFDYGEKFYESVKKKYDFALYRAIDISLDWLNDSRLPHGSKKLRDCLQTLEHRIEGHDYWATTEMAIHYALCEKKGLNAYTSANRVNGLQIDDFHTFIHMNPAFEKVYAALGLRRYITISVGFDKVSETKGMQTKCWPLDRFKELVRLIKLNYPKIMILQTDGGNIYQVPGCDRYLMGTDMELVKYILRGALLHISIEGGLVHLASQLDTKCLVLFGPTPKEYYGYDININIQAGKCHNCLWLEPGNHYTCCRNLATPECMESITPKLVYDAVETYLSDIV